MTLIRGWSRDIELPEPADVLVAEVIGNEPFEEEILETTLDARRRLLKPDARLIPHALELVARPLLIPDAEARQRAIGPQAIQRWRQLYGIEFEPLLDAAFPGPVNNPTEADVLARWPPVGPPVTLATVELGVLRATHRRRVRRARRREHRMGQRNRHHVPRAPTRNPRSHT